MRRAVHAEWTKLRTMPSTAWLVLGAVAVTVALSAAVVASVDARHGPADTTQLSLYGVRLGQIVVAVLAVLAVSNEYATKLIHATLTANPHRYAVLATKALVVTAVTVVVGVLGVSGSLVAARGILPGNGFAALSLADEPTRRAAVGSVLYLVLIALLSLGIAAIVRDTAGAITTVFALLFMFPMVALLVDDPRWHTRLEKFAPMTAGLNIQATRGLPDLPIGPWAGLGVLSAYAAAAVLLGAASFRFRDA